SRPTAKVSTGRTWCLRRGSPFFQMPVAIHRGDCEVPLVAPSPVHRQLEVLSVGFPQAEDVPAVAGRGVAAAPLGEACLSAAAALDHSGGANDVAMPLASQLDPQPVITAGVGYVVEDCYRLVDVADHDVHLAVVVQVAQRGTAAEVVLPEIRTASLADIC